MTEIIDAVPKEIDARQLAQQLVEQASTTSCCR